MVLVKTPPVDWEQHRVVEKVEKQGGVSACATWKLQ